MAEGPRRGSSRAVIVIGILASAGILAFLLLDRDPPPPAPELTEPAPQPPPEEVAPVGVAEERESAAVPPPAPRMFDGVQRVPLLSREKVNVARLAVRIHPDPGHVLRVQAERAGRAADWEAVGAVAQWLALDGLRKVPAGLRIDLSVADTMPRPEHAVALATALRLAAFGRAYPPDRLVTSMIAPDHTLVEAGDPRITDKLATSAGVRVVRAATWGALLETLGAPAPPRTQGRRLAYERVPRDLHAPAVERVRQGLREVLGGVGGGRPVELPPPRGWREMVATAETELRGAPVRSLDEIVTVGVAAAAIRHGVRAVRFATERLGAFTKKLLRDNTPLAGWPVDWLSMLVTGRIDGEAALARWRTALPRPGGARTIRPPARWLRERAETLSRVAAAFARLRELAVPMARQLPRPYPYGDLRNLAWVPEPVDSRAPITDWGVYVERLALAWSQLAIGMALEPTPVTGRVEVGGAYQVVEHERLVDMLQAAEAELREVSGRVQTREGHALTEVRRLAGDGRAPATVERLERLWYAIVLAREAARLAEQLSDR